MALGTADGSGTPWVSPVWYAPLSYREYVWVSRPGTRHSRNLAERPQIAIYDSHRPGGWTALDRKSTRLNSSHGSISYAVFCFKKINITVYIPAFQSVILFVVSPYIHT